MKILFLSFYFEPDLCAGSFRNTPLFRTLLSKISVNDSIHVITTMPNRYHTYNVDVQPIEIGVNFRIDRIQLPEHKNGFIDQIKAFFIYYKETKKITENENFNLVYASSSRLFTAYLGRRISFKKNAKLFLDIRDIFVDTIKDIFKYKPLIQKPLTFLLKRVEYYTFSKANHINLVSQGFEGYFSKYKQPTFSFLTNGIDDVFLKISEFGLTPNNIQVITYAGNIGNGQGLEKIVPQAAQLLGNKYLFQIIGDGGTKRRLIDKIHELKVENVKVLNPVSRKELLEYYKRSDYLFLHLNDLEAFKKVLPSKIFEYAVFPVPIIAGVAGYANHFIHEKIENHILFAPTDYKDMVNQILGFHYQYKNRDSFVKNFSRLTIINELANKILYFKKENP